MHTRKNTKIEQTFKFENMETAFREYAAMKGNLKELGLTYLYDDINMIINVGEHVYNFIGEEA